ADANEWAARSLASSLGPSGVQGLQLHAGPEVAAAARTQASDAILLTESLPETDVAALVRSLRQDPDVPAELPIILIGIGPVSRLRLIAALRAGASDLWGLPMDSEELVLRLEALVRLKSAAGWGAPSWPSWRLMLTRGARGGSAHGSGAPSYAPPPPRDSSTRYGCAPGITPCATSTVPRSGRSIF